MRLLLAVLAVVLTLVASPPTAIAQPIKRVEVVNFPNPQNVTGSVEVSNLPSVQDVNVTNEPLAVLSPPRPRIQLVGFTSGNLTSDTGVLGFTLACQAEFAESRMCSSMEVLESVSVPSGLNGTAWVRPSFTPVSISGGSNTTVALDASGVQRAGAPGSDGLLSCSGWSQSVTASGLTLDANGRFVGRPCNDAVGRSVACCAGPRSGGQSRTVSTMPGQRRQRDPSTLRTVRLRLAPKLTREETRKLEEQAAADLRSVAN